MRTLLEVVLIYSDSSFCLWVRPLWSSLAEPPPVWWHFTSSFLFFMRNIWLYLSPLRILLVLCIYCGSFLLEKFYAPQVSFVGAFLKSLMPLRDSLSYKLYNNSLPECFIPWRDFLSCELYNNLLLRSLIPRRDSLFWEFCNNMLLESLIACGDSLTQELYKISLLGSFVPRRDLLS